MACTDSDGNFISADSVDVFREHHQESIPDEKVMKSGDSFVLKDNPKIRLIAQAHKISKSRGNFVNPDHVVFEYGADSLCLYEMFVGPFRDSKAWNTGGIEGVHQFLGRVWRSIVGSSLPNGTFRDGTVAIDNEPILEQLRSLHKCIDKTLSSWATSSVEEVASTGPGIRFFQLYVYKDRKVVAQLVRRAERAGFKAIALTVDTPRLGRREADIKNRFTLPPFLTLKNFEGLDLGKMDQSDDSGLASYVAGQIDRSLSWKDVKWLQTITQLPILVKGVLTAEDARLAVQAGAAGIIVSNHGARQLDYVPATIMALEEVVKAAQGRVPVFLDGGVRRGTDVFKALALGASGIFIGRPVVFSLAAEGEAGIRKVLQMLRDEFELTMALSGCRSLKEITRNHIVTDWDLPRPHPVARL